LLDRESRRSSDLFDCVIGSREDAVAVILGHFDKMLSQERRKLVEIFHLVPELCNGRRRVFDLGAENVAHDGGDLGVVHFDRASERVRLALMAFRIGQDMGDDAPLVVARDGRVAAILEWKFNLLLCPDLLREMRIDEPVGKEGRAEMGCRNALPVEDPLRDPVILRGMAR
jgi:hypothetical protein